MQLLGKPFYLQKDGHQLEILIELVGKALGSLKILGVFVGSQMSYPGFTTFEPTHSLKV